MLLCSGITGFQPTPSVGEIEFKTICYYLFGSNELDFVEDGTAAKNFYECVIKMKDKRVHVLLNNHYPFIAFTAARKSDEHSLPFIDDPELSKVFNPYYKVLRLDQLNESVKFYKKGKNIIVKNENTLHEGELEQFVYWQPKTVGDVVFNYWD